jgi:CRISPR-associated protein Cmr4
MERITLSLLAETAVHVGDPDDDGPDRLQRRREDAPRAPEIAASTVRGALAAAARTVFGPDDERVDAVASLRVADARAVLVPLRSLSCNYAWISCPALLVDLAGAEENTPPEPGPQEAVTSIDDEVLYVEELHFEKVDALDETWLAILAAFVPDESVRARLGAQIAVLCDEDFDWLMQHGFPVQARARLDANGRPRAVWHEELIPPDSLFGVELTAETTDALDALDALVAERDVLRVGANASIGQGWMRMQRVDAYEEGS